MKSEDRDRSAAFRASWKFRRRDGKERRRMSGETPLDESHRAGIMQFQTKIT